MSNGAVVAGGGLVLLAVAATSVVMFGNVGATQNNLPVSLHLLLVFVYNLTWWFITHWRLASCLLLFPHLFV